MLITVFLVSFAAIYATAAPTQILYDDQGNVVDVIPDADNNGGPPDVFSIYVNENATESGIAAPDFKLADGFPSVVFCTGETFTGQCVSVHSNRDHCGKYFGRFQLAMMDMMLMSQSLFNSGHPFYKLHLHRQLGGTRFHFPLPFLRVR